MSLQLHNVKKSYREPDGNILPVLNVESFALDQGEQVVLVGESGGGKTTLLNAISGITTVDSGEVIVDGVDLTRLPEAAATASGPSGSASSSRRSTSSPPSPPSRTSCSA